MNNNNVPQVRFKGFTDVWEQRKLGNVFTQTSYYVNPKEDNIELWSLTVEEGLVPKTERYTRDFLVKKEDKFKEVRTGDIVYNPMNMTLGAIGYNNMAKSIAVSGYYVTMVANNNTDPYFINTWLKSPQAILTYKNYATGSLKEKQRIQFPTLSAISVSFPELEEQRAIGRYFSNLDNLITLHQRKCETLQKLKKSMLQKMFPKNGSLYPEIRFAGFTDAWEQRKLSDLLILSSDRNSEGTYSQDDVLACSLGTELQKKTIFFGLRSTEDSVKNYRIVNKGDVIYTKSPIKGFPNGIIRTNKGLSGIVPSLYCVYHTVSDVNPSIIQAYFEDKTRLDNYLCPLVNIGARNNVNITDIGFLAGEIRIPKSIDEQTLIVDYIDNLTNLITLHQQKTETLKKLKKSMLQKMFI